ncbi:MAG: hypothetical protein WBV21_04945 [Desulfobacterales bacterium]
MRMFSPMAAESLRADELEERIQLRVGARVRELRQAEAENEALNIARFKAAYLKVALDPWHAALRVPAPICCSKGCSIRKPPRWWPLPKLP